MKCFVFSVLLLSSLVSTSQLQAASWIKICNKTNEQVRWASGMKWWDDWISVGWVTLAANTCDEVLAQWESKKYFYAETVSGSKQWRPKHQLKKFCVDRSQEEFQIDNCRNPDVDFGLFAPFEGVKTLNLR